MRPVLSVAPLALCACSLISLDGLDSQVALGARDAGTDAGGADGGSETSLPPPTPYAQTVLADSPLAYWRFDEASGTTARDFSGNGHDATYMGGVQLGGPGAIAGESDGAAIFDGSSGYVDAGDLFAFAGSQAFSVEAWVRSVSEAGYGGIFSREDVAGGPPSEGYLGFVSPSNGVYGFQRLDGNDLTSVTSTASASGQYDHVVATYDGTTMTIYVDGAAQNMQTSSFGIAGAVNHFVVGAEAGGAEAFFRGVLDEVAVYEHVLSPTRVNAHYLAGTGHGG
jgi:hypothetical protein